jgi:branched-chain amino acid aminotransferase
MAKMSEKHIYEVIRFEQGVAIFVEDHLDRLYKSARVCGIRINFTEKDIYDKYNSGNFDEDKIINIRIEVDENGYAFNFAEPVKTDSKMYIDGVRVKTVMQERKNPNVKSSEQSYFSTLHKIYKNEDIFEFILYDNNILKEGTRSNFFAVKNGVLYTQDSKAVLMGVTRKKVFMLAKSLEIPICHDDIYIDKISDMDAFFITGTSIGVMPVGKIDNAAFSSAGNETVLKLRNAYDNYVREYIKINKKARK